MDTVVLETRDGAVLRYPRSFSCRLVETSYHNARAASFVPEAEALTRSQRRRSRKKSHRKPNKGEILQNEYHAKVKDNLMLCYTHLLEMGRNCGYFPVHQATTCPQFIGSDLDLVSFCELDALVPLAEVQQPLLIDRDRLTDLDLYGHLVCNPSDMSVDIPALGRRFHIPSHSSFLLSDFSKIGLLVDSAASLGKQFDLIIMDPPWENRSAIRGKKYHWLSMEELFGMPIPKFASPGALVAMWVTNKRKFAHFVQQALFPAWRVKTVGEWHWIKVTTAGNLVHDMDSSHKKPYETLIIGKYMGDSRTCPLEGVASEQRSSCPSAMNEGEGTEIRDADPNAVVSSTEEGQFLQCSGGSTAPLSVHSKQMSAEIQSNEHSSWHKEIPITLSELADSAERHVMEQNTGPAGSINPYCCTPLDGTRTDEPSSKRPRLCPQFPLSPCKAAGGDHTPTCVDIPYHCVILCVPSCVHSQKPYLGDLLLKYTSGRKHCLELFARNLLPNWTSWGNEVLKFQEISSN